MNNFKAIFASSLIAFALTSTSFARPVDMETYDSSGAVATATVSFDTKGFASTNESQQYDLATFVPSWSLGVIGFDINGANLGISEVEGSDMIKVTLSDASGGASQDKLKFSVTADANTPKGSYPMLVTLTNSKFGDTGTIMIMVEVN
jgi:opacity protein-like surface antigen